MIDKEKLTKVAIVRFDTGEQGTQGNLVCNEFECKTLELPWRNNIRSYSCIPPGEYICVPHKYRRRYKSFRLLDVPNRSFILIHHGNWSGDTKLGYRSNVEGCILLGSRFGNIYNQKAVLNSRNTIRKFITIMDWEPFLLKIIDLTGMVQTID
jgi:hypothetical protein